VVKKTLILWILASLSVISSPLQAQEGEGVSAPTNYYLDIVGLPNDQTSAFTLNYHFIGNTTAQEAVRLNLTAQAILQPEPATFSVAIKAEGDLNRYGLVPRAALTPTRIHLEHVYWRKGYYTAVELPDTNTVLCGKQTLAPNAAGLRLENQLPFPKDLFFENTLPPLVRVLPDGEFDGKPTARYALAVDTPVLQGQAEAEIVPEDNALVRFNFVGEGRFRSGDMDLEGTLTYEFERVIPPADFEAGRPALCQTPNIQGVPIYEPSVQWIIRADGGEFTAAKSIPALIAFYAQTLEPLGFLFQLRQDNPNLRQTLVTYTAPTGDTVYIELLEVVDGGVEVTIQIQPAFLR
jgi:hypothetical protein